MSKVNFLKSATFAVAGLAVVTSISSCSIMNKKTEEKHSCKAATTEKEKNSCKATKAKKESKKSVESTKPTENKKAN